MTRHTIVIDGRHEAFWRKKTQGIWFSAFFCAVLTVLFAWQGPKAGASRNLPGIGPNKNTRLSSERYIQ